MQTFLNVSVQSPVFVSISLGLVFLLGNATLGIVLDLNTVKGNGHLSKIIPKCNQESLNDTLNLVSLQKGKTI